MTQTVLTPTVGRTLRRSLFWIGVAVFALIIAVVSFSIAGSGVAGTPLESTNAAPGGGMAVAEVLRQQGVDVVATSTLDGTRAEIDDPDDTTLLLYDGNYYLTDEQLQQAVGLAAHVVVVDPGFDALLAVAPELAQAGYVDDELAADCDVDAVRRAGMVSGEASGYRVVDDSAEVTACLGSGDDVYSLVQLERDGTVVTVLGTTGALSNEFVVNDGNAALALNLLGQHDTLVWYFPGVGDLPPVESAADLSPGWVVPVLVLLVLTFAAAAIWRGRRFGPLVVENLPVTVRASETMLGRARLYERSSSRLRALDSLRIGSIRRLGVLCGLPRAASVDDVVAAVAAATGADAAGIRSLLVDAQPANDRDLIALSDRLLVLERDVAAALRP